MKEKGIAEIKDILNSEDNFAMMDKSANASKWDVKIVLSNITFALIRKN